MAMPPAPVGCPPGLEYLAQIDQLIVKQQTELLEGKTNNFSICLTDNTSILIFSLFHFRVPCRNFCVYSISELFYVRVLLLIIDIRFSIQFFYSLLRNY